MCRSPIPPPPPPPRVSFSGLVQCSAKHFARIWKCCEHYLPGVVWYGNGSGVAGCSWWGDSTYGIGKAVPRGAGGAISPPPPMIFFFACLSAQRSVMTVIIPLPHCKKKKKKKAKFKSEKKNVSESPPPPSPPPPTLSDFFVKALDGQGTNGSHLLLIRNVGNS